MLNDALRSGGRGQGKLGGSRASMAGTGKPAEPSPWGSQACWRQVISKETDHTLPCTEDGSWQAGLQLRWAEVKSMARCVCVLVPATLKRGLITPCHTQKKVLNYEVENKAQEQKLLVRTLSQKIRKKWALPPDRASEGPLKQVKQTEAENRRSRPEPRGEAALKKHRRKETTGT